MFHFENIAQYHQQLLQGKTSCAEAVEFYLSNCDANSHLNAYVNLYANEAREHAHVLDERRRSGSPVKKLHGVVVSIKDVLSYKGHVITAASRMLEGFECVYNATVVQALLDEEAIVIGTCNCDEFAMGSTNEHSAYGNVLNGLDNRLVPGGSSGGSAVAVQMEMCMVSLGSDTGGSVRQPADFCGIIGLKPGYGRLSRYGLFAYASSFDQVGILAKNIADIAITLAVISKADAFDSTMEELPVFAIDDVANKADKKFRFCYFTQMLEHPSLDREIAADIFETIEALKEDGHKVEEASFDLLDFIVPAYYVLTTAEASSNLSRYDGVRYGRRSDNHAEDLSAFYLQNRSEGFGMEVKRRIMLGTFVLSTGYYDAYYNKAQQVRAMLQQYMQMIFSKFDAVLLPTSPSTAYPIGDKDKDPIAVYLADIFTVLANLVGIPAISVPLYRHSNGLPCSLQIMANKGDELTLLQVCNELIQKAVADPA